MTRTRTWSCISAWVKDALRAKTALKGRQLEVGAQRAPRLLVSVIKASKHQQIWSHEVSKQITKNSQIHH